MALTLAGGCMIAVQLRVLSQTDLLHDIAAVQGVTPVAPQVRGSNTNEPAQLLHFQ